MENKIKTNQKHMTQEDRMIIEKRLDEKTPLCHIAEELRKDPTTIAKEIKKHRIFQQHNTFNDKPNRCALAPSCHRKNLCEIFAPICKKECKYCPRCHKHCPDFIPYDYHCKLTDKAPYVCNGCQSKARCRLDKYFYRATKAQKEYKTILSESRTGINISEEELTMLDETVSPLVMQGQSVYMILQNHPEITLCEKTIYNYIDSGFLSVGNIDLPKKVKYKVRKSHEFTVDDSGIFSGRTYKDFQAFIKDNHDIRITEMDTVLGREGSKKILLTLHFGETNFMMAYLLESKEARGVEAVFDSINSALGTPLFYKAMPVILTDRGGEFRHPDALECSVDNVIRTSVFYCDPMSSWQKPHCEKNHEYIRKICPQGKTSFDRLTQEDVNLMMSHINSSCRESLGGLSPFALAKLMLPKELLSFFNLTEIPPDDIILTPKLLKGKIEV